MTRLGLPTKGVQGKPARAIGRTAGFGFFVSRRRPRMEVESNAQVLGTESIGTPYPVDLSSVVRSRN